MSHHLSTCPRNWNMGPCNCGSQSRRTESEARTPIGNATHKHPRALVFCLCCGVAVEGDGYQVQYAPEAIPDIYCKKQCHDQHIQALCNCNELQQVKR